MPSQQVTIKQHYVPQFYLRQWIDSTGGFYPVRVEERMPPRLSVFTKKSNPRRFCYENFFYAQHTGIEDQLSQIIEKSFTEIEAVFSTELPRLEAKILNNEQITEEDKYQLAQCMIFLHFRGKKYLDESKRMTDEMMKKIYKRSVHFIDKDPKRKAKMEELGVTKQEMVDFINGEQYTIDFGNAHHLRILEDMTGFSNLLFAKYWRIYLSREGNFITTDAPYIDRPLSRSFYGNDFLSREQTFILSPKVMVVALNPRNEGGKKIGRRDLTGQHGIVLYLNAHNLMYSIRFGFHKDRNLLTKVETMATMIHQQRLQERRDEAPEARR